MCEDDLSRREVRKQHVKSAKVKRNGRKRRAVKKGLNNGRG